MDEDDFLCYGLVQIVKREDWERPTTIPVPLVSVEVKASVVHAVAQVQVSQVYLNKENQPIEAIYYFPVNPDGAVTHFHAELEGRIIKGSVKPAEEAKAAYYTAVENQTTAVLGEETKADIFKVRVGFLKPGSQIKVVIGYVTEVKNEPGTNVIRFYIPTTIAPRYVSPSEREDKAQEIGNMTVSSISQGPLSLKVAVSLQAKIRSIKSPTHKVKVGKSVAIGLADNPTWDKAVVEFDGETTDMDRDFVLNILPAHVHKPRLYSEELVSGSVALMLHLVPSFNLDEQKTELIFVLDRSGSMMGQSIELVRKALLLFLHSMPADCYFNIVGFGETFETLFPKSVKYDDMSLKEAVSHAKYLEADLGGTEILGPLKEIYGRPPIRGYLRQIFILTDGEVSDTDRLVGIVKANAYNTRVFALGIGDGASHHLVEGIASAGGGTSAFVTYNEPIDKKVLNQLKNGLQPSLTDIEVEWEGVEEASPVSWMKIQKAPLNKEKPYNKPITTAEGDMDTQNDQDIVPSYQQSPKRIPPVYDGCQLLVFGLFKYEIPTAVIIKGQSPDGPLTLRVEHSAESDVGSTVMLHRLAAVKLVRELEVELAAVALEQDMCYPGGQVDNLKQDIIGIACENGISSKYTSFVVVDGNGRDAPLKGNCAMMMKRKYVPSQVADGQDERNLVCRARRVSRRERCSEPSLDFDSAYFETLLQKTPPSSERNCLSRKKSLDFEVCKVGSPERGPSNNHHHDRMRRGSAFPDEYYEDGMDVQMEGLRLMSSSSRMRRRQSVQEPPTSNVTLVEKLVSLQSFDGSYSLDAKLSRLLGNNLEKLKHEAGKRNLTERVLATALVVAYFTYKLGAEQDIWHLVVAKADKWLTQQIPAEQIEQLVNTAIKLL